MTIQNDATEALEILDKAEEAQHDLTDAVWLEGDAEIASAITSDVSPIVRRLRERVAGLNHALPEVQYAQRSVDALLDVCTKTLSDVEARLLAASSDANHAPCPTCGR